MLKFACKDVGVDCDFVATGATVEELQKKAFEHASVAHADLLKGMSEAQRAEMARAVEASIKPA